MNHIHLDAQDEAVKRFFLSMPVDSQGTVVELDDKGKSWVVAAVGPDVNGDEPWTDEKNNRRCDLIDRKFSGRALAPTEAIELAQLQEQMLRYRDRVAPLPLEDARRLHQELLAKAAGAQANA